jgi:hypothetical protein
MQRTGKIRIVVDLVSNESSACGTRTTMTTNPIRQSGAVREGGSQTAAQIGSHVQLGETTTSGGWNGMGCPRFKNINICHDGETREDTHLKN